MHLSRRTQYPAMVSGTGVADQAEGEVKERAKKAKDAAAR
jgi:uncharacterized protein YjbJ (UPF0337 family)